MNALRQNDTDMPPPAIALGSVLWRRKWIILLGSLIGLALGLLITLHTEKKWRADAQMVLLQRMPSANANPIPSYSAPILETVDTQVGMIQSPAMAERTITYLKNKALAEGKSTDTIGVDAGELSEDITVFNPRDTNLINVSVAASEPTQAAVLADAVCHAFQQWKEDLGRRDAVSAEESLSARANRAKAALVRAEQAETRYKQRSGLMDTQPDMGVLISRLQSTQGALTVAQAQSASAQAALSTVGKQFKDATAALSAGQSVRDDASVQSIQARLSQAQADYASAQTLYRQDYPGPVTTAGATYPQIKSQIASLTAQLKSAIANTVDNKAPSLASQGALHDAYEQALVVAAAAQANLTAANRARDEALHSKVSFPQNSLTLTQLERDRLLAESQWTGLQQALSAARLDEDKIVSNIQITQGAEVPGEPFKPSLPRYLLLGLFLGALCSVFLALLLEQRDQRLRNVPELRQLVTGPIIAILPKLSRLQIQNAGRGRALPEVQEAASFAWVNLWQMLQRLPQNGEKQAILITSAIPREGKTFVAGQMARFIAQTGKRVILVDANLHQDKRRRTSAAGQPGLTEILAGAVPIEGALQDTDLKNLQTVSCGAGAENPILLLSQPGVPAAFQALRSHADIVIIDAPDCTSVPDTALLASHADCLIQVIGMNRVTAAAMLDTSIALQSTDKPTIFFVNAAEASQSATYRNQNLMFGHFNAALPAPAEDTRTREMSRTELNPLSKTLILARSEVAPNGRWVADHGPQPAGRRDKDPAAD